MQRSVIGHILPEAMVCYLENYEPEKFAQIFLGEFDTPEAIWSNEMRWNLLCRLKFIYFDVFGKLDSYFSVFWKFKIN